MYLSIMVPRQEDLQEIEGHQEIKLEKQTVVQDDPKHKYLKQNMINLNGRVVGVNRVIKYMYFKKGS